MLCGYFTVKYLYDKNTLFEFPVRDDSEIV